MVLITPSNVKLTTDFNSPVGGDSVGKFTDFNDLFADKIEVEDFVAFEVGV